jgi:hypothetical protein
MTGADRRARWHPWAGSPQAPAPSITEAIEGLTDRVVAFREEKEKAMSDTTNQQPQQTGIAPTAVADQAPAATPLPPAPTIAPPPVVAPPPATKPAPAGGFVASLRAMMDEARAGLDQARAEGMAVVQGAIGELHQAKAATTKVTGTMADRIKSEAADVMAELGQISNDL